MYTIDVIEKLIQRFPEVSKIPVPEKFVRDPEPQANVPPQKLLEVCRFLKSDAAFSFDFPTHMTAVDHLKDGLFELVYALYSTQHRVGLILKSHVSRTSPEIDSVSSVWKGMDWQEREVFE